MYNVAMRDLPTPRPDDIEGNIESAEDLHQQLAAAVAEAAKTGDFTQAEEIKRQLEDKLEPLKRQLEAKLEPLKKEAKSRDLTFTEMFEGQEITLKAKETLQLSTKFYQEHELQEFADNLPQEIHFSVEGKKRIREALKMGFDNAIILPSTEIQGRSIDTLIEQMAKKPHAGLSDTDQYGDPGIGVGDGRKQPQNRNNTAKAYMLMYQSKPVPPETKGKTPDQLETLFKQKKWNGLTMSEYLVLQRCELEKRKNHSFDAYDEDVAKSQWSWLLDSRASRPKVACASWSAEGQCIDVHWDDVDDSDPELGARPTVVVELQ